MLKVAFVMNPTAGIGGPLALKGSDSLSDEIRELHRGHAMDRSKLFLESLRSTRARLNEEVHWVSVAGPMGGDLFDLYQIDFESVYRPSLPTSAQDTIETVKRFEQSDCDLIVFAGGDGTARDVLEGLELNSKTPVIGLPSGVKMHSGVFSVTPVATASILEGLITSQMVNLGTAEIRDYVNSSGIETQYYGEVLVPKTGRYLQQTKVGGKESEELAVQEIASELEECYAEKRLLFGPGSTCRDIKERFGLPKESSTLLGFDMYSPNDGWMLDLTADQINQLLQEIDYLVISFTRGQGFLLGRGNQQLNAEALSSLVWPSQFVLVGTRTKLSSLHGNPLLVDLGDPSLNDRFKGLAEVVTGFNDRVLHRVDSELSGE